MWQRYLCCSLCLWLGLDLIFACALLYDTTTTGCSITGFTSSTNSRLRVLCDPFFLYQSHQYLCHQNAKVSANPESLCHTLDQSVEDKLNLHCPKTRTFSCLETLSCPWVGVCVLWWTGDWSRVCSCISVTAGIKPQLSLFVCLFEVSV